MKAWIALIAGFTMACSSTQPSSARRSGEILSRAEPPGLVWRPSQRVDVDCDATVDEVFTAQDEHRFYVGVVLGSRGEDRYSIVAFALTGEWQESFCGPFESLTPEPLSSAMADATGEEELVDWWRL